jgi:hypothetical protein
MLNQYLTNPLTDASTHTISHHLVNQSVSEDVISRLDSTDPSNLPVLVKFLLQSAPQDNTALKEMLLSFRSTLHIDPSHFETSSSSSSSSSSHGHGDNRDCCALTLDTMGNSLRLRSDVAVAFMKSIQDSKGTSSHHPIDIW